MTSSTWSGTNTAKLFNHDDYNWRNVTIGEYKSMRMLIIPSLVNKTATWIQTDLLGMCTYNNVFLAVRVATQVLEHRYCLLTLQLMINL